MKCKETYAELLRKPEWQKKRLEIMQRDDFTCQYCGSKERELQVHHRVYHNGAKPWEYDNSELITLCDQCHEVETDVKNQHYDVYKNICTLSREVGLSEQFIESLLSRVLSVVALLSHKEEDYGLFGGEEEMLKNTLYGTQLINDAKIIFSSRIKLNEREKKDLEMYCEPLYNIYKKNTL